MLRILKKTKYILLIMILIILFIYMYTLKRSLKREEYNVVNSMGIENISREDNSLENDDNKKIRVDIKGAINNPGVYEVDNGSRIIDLIDLASGLRDDADTSLINLSKLLSDEMVIYIYTKEEVKNSNLVNTVIKVVEKECVCPNIENDGCINDRIEDTISNSEGSKLININIASLDELMTIPGIGKQKAEAIIKYRNDIGIFNNISDIMNVNGIGNSLYEAIKEYITT